MNKGLPLLLWSNVAPERLEATRRLIFNNQLDSGLTALFAGLLLLLLAEAFYEWGQLLWGKKEPVLLRARPSGTAPLSREGFFLDALRRRYSNVSRCC